MKHISIKGRNKSTHNLDCDIYLW